MILKKLMSFFGQKSKHKNNKKHFKTINPHLHIKILSRHSDTSNKNQTQKRNK